MAAADPGEGAAPAGEPSADDPVYDRAAHEADRLRSAMRRRGPVEARLGDNRGQAAMVRERDRMVESIIRDAAPASARLLDVGCGEGATLSRLIAEGAVATGVGVDLLPERIERARIAWPAIDFRVADAGQLPFPDGSFDVVLAMTVFSSIPQHVRPAIALEVARVVRPGGLFVWYDLRRQSPTNSDVRPFSSADVARLFRGWTVAGSRLTVLPPIARRLGPMTEALYPLLAQLPILLSHEAGVSRRPADP